jgi:hypothetical protein
MAINKNHEIEELNGIRCSIAEKNVPVKRMEFLKKLLEFNKYTVVVAASPAPKVAAAKAAPVVKTVTTEAAAVPPVATGAATATTAVATTAMPAKAAAAVENAIQSAQPVTAIPAAENATAQPVPVTPPATFTIGVTNLAFNPVNAVFGRLLHTPDGHVVTLAYWHQKEVVSHDEIPYYEDK